MDALTLAKVAREMTTGLELLSHPEHPLLIDGPDYLAGGTGTLVAILVVRSAEKHSLARLKARYALSRLAYPAFTHWVLVADDAVSWVRRTTADFHEVVVLRAGGIGPSWSHDLPPLNPNQVSLFWERAAVLETISHRAAGATHDGLDQIADETGLTDVLGIPDRNRRDGHPRWKPRGLVSIEGGILGIAPDGPARGQVEPFLRWLTERSVRVDEGVPFLVDPRVGLLSASASIPGDPSKLVRAAALAGWVLVPRRRSAVIGAAHALTRGHARWRE